MNLDGNYTSGPSAEEKVAFCLDRLDAADWNDLAEGLDGWHDSVAPALTVEELIGALLHARYELDRRPRDRPPCTYGQPDAIPDCGDLPLTAPAPGPSSPGPAVVLDRPRPTKARATMRSAPAVVVPSDTDPDAGAGADAGREGDAP